MNEYRNEISKGRNKKMDKRKKKERKKEYTLNDCIFPGLILVGYIYIFKRKKNAIKTPEKDTTYSNRSDFNDVIKEKLSYIIFDCSVRVFYSREAIGIFLN